MKLTKMIDAPVLDLDSDTETGTLVDVLIDTRSGDVQYVLIDKATGLGHESVLVSRQRIAHRDGRWHVHITPEEVVLRDPGIRRDANTPLDLCTMPPVLIGPFGYTVSPVLAGAMINAITGKSRAERPTIDQSHSDWFWFDSLQALPLFDSSGPLGHLADIVIDPMGLTCLSLVSRADDGAMATHAMGTLRHVTRNQDSIILELSDTPPYSVKALINDGV
jgi:hypothetical protein